MNSFRTLCLLLALSHDTVCFLFCIKYSVFKGSIFPDHPRNSFCKKHGDSFSSCSWCLYQTLYTWCPSFVVHKITERKEKKMGYFQTQKTQYHNRLSGSLACIVLSHLLCPLILRYMAHFVHISIARSFVLCNLGQLLFSLKVYALMQCMSHIYLWV